MRFNFEIFDLVFDSKSIHFKSIRERNNSASSGAIWRLADLANGESRSQDRQSDDDTPEPKKRKLEEGDDRPEE